MSELRRNELYYGVAAIAERLGLSKSKARQWISAGVITARRDGEGPTASWYSTENLIRQSLDRLEKGD
jgi:excisionase family DNA binding protein